MISSEHALVIIDMQEDFSAALLPLIALMPF